MTTIITDGTGKGFLAKVDDQNRLLTRSTADTRYDEASVSGESFNLNTEFVSITVGTETPLLYFKNNEPNDVIVVGWFIGIGIAGGTPTEHALMRVYGGANTVSGGVDIPVTNRRIGSGRAFDFTAKRQDSGTPLSVTLPSTPVLYQTQTAASRVFGTVYLTVPRSQTLTVTCQLNGYQTANIYTGFTGYVAE